MMHKVMQRGAITLRNLPPAVARAVRERAQADGISLNKAVIRLLEQAVGMSRSKRAKPKHDLSEFVGVWTDEELREFERNLREQRRIAPEMWK